MGIGVGLGLMGAGSLAGALGSKPGSSETTTRLLPPPLGWGQRKQSRGMLGRELRGLVQGGGGFGADYTGQAFQQAQSMMAPAMRQAQTGLNFAQMQRGIFDSGAAQQQQAGLQGAFMTQLSRSAMDAVLRNAVQRRTESMQALGMLMGGITPMGTATESTQQGASMSTLGALGQGLFGMAGGGVAGMALQGMMNPQSTSTTPYLSPAGGPTVSPGGGTILPGPSFNDPLWPSQ